jgi:hypothetical protein
VQVIGVAALALVLAVGLIVGGQAYRGTAAEVLERPQATTNAAITSG